MAYCVDILVCSQQAGKCARIPFFLERELRRGLVLHSKYSDSNHPVALSAAEKNTSPGYLISLFFKESILK